MNTSLFPSLLCSLAMAALLAACGGDSPDKLIASAKTYLDKRDPAAAVIELKNALQKTPDSAEARFLLGKALLAQSEAEAASVELRKAAELKYPDALLVPLLARALNASGQWKKVSDSYAATVLPDAAAQADLKTALAVAYAAQGKLEDAQRALAAALQAAPDNAQARLFDARLKAGQGGYDAALATADAVLAKAPDNDDAWLLKAELLTQRIPANATAADLSGAVEAYRKALALRKNSMGAYSGLITLLIDRKQLDEAARELAALKKVWPNHPQTKWFDARIALGRGDYAEARKLAEQLLVRAPTDARLLYLAGVSQFATGATVQAESSLGKALAAVPDSLLTRRMLARTELRLGQPAKALAAIQPAVDVAAPDAESLSLAAQAHLLAGDTAKAQDYFARAAKADPADVRSRTALALTQLSRGGGAAALGDLQNLAAEDKGNAADLGLINVYLRRKDADAALKAIAALEKKQPGNPLTAHLRGIALLVKNDEAGARDSFERALATDPKYFPSAARLATLDLGDKKPDAATKQFERVLAADPKNASALLALVDLKAATGGSKEELLALIQNAIKANPAEVAPRLRAVELQLRSGDAKAALAAAQDAMVVMPDDPQLLEALGAAQLAAGELNQATASFTRLASLQPASPAAYMHLSDVQLALKDEAAALQSLKRAAAIAPAVLPVQRKLLQLLLNAKRFPEALEVARGLQKLAPANAVGYAFEGDIEASRKNYAAAAVAYRTAQAKGKSTEVAVKLHSVLLDAKQTAEADKMAAAWRADNPKDASFISYLGGIAVVLKDYAAAEARYREVIGLDPDNAAALNNVAWLMTEQKKKGALEYVEKADSLRPNQPTVLDTLATVLEAESQPDKAVTAQKKAVELAPDNAGYRMHLAKLSLRNGDKAGARAELERLSKLGDKFADQAEVGRLLKAL